MTLRRQNQKKIVIALGGNAIQSPKKISSFDEQRTNFTEAARSLSEVVKRGYKIAITHGNGPQVGDILLQQELSKEYVAPKSLAVCGAQTQGQIGLLLKQSLDSNFKKLGIKKEVAVVLTQVLVSSKDPAFSNPTKPIGPFYTPIEARKYRKQGIPVQKIMVGVFRRVVPSPAPQRIMENKVIQKLFESGVVVIAVGGGGIPTIVQRDELRGVDAVIDKDLASELLASSIKAEIFIILTNVKSVALNFGKPNQKWLSHLSVAEAKEYLKEGHFARGSMKPKIEACIKFIENGGKKAIIAHLKDLIPALEGKAGTIIQ